MDVKKLKAKVAPLKKVLPRKKSSKGSNSPVQTDSPNQSPSRNLPKHSLTSNKPPSIKVEPDNSDEDPFDAPTPELLKRTSEKAREETRKDMIDLYKTNKELFFLNQLFFSVQFFPLYSSDQQQIQQNTSVVDHELSNKSREFQVSYTGMLYEHIGKTITLKLPQEETLLQPLEYVMEYKGPIEILPVQDLRYYDPLTNDIYRFAPQEFNRNKRKGYARLLWNETMNWEKLFCDSDIEKKMRSNREDTVEEFVKKLAEEHVPALCLTRAILENNGDEEDGPVKLWYLSSSKFAKWFLKDFDLQLDADKDTTDVPFIKCTDTCKNVTYHRYYKPTLYMGFWPDCAQSFLDIRKGQTKLGKEFKWPTDINIAIATKIGCDLEPLTKFEERILKGNGLIWKISFSRIENYLMSTLTHCQLRCYLFLLIIIRDNCGAKASLLKELLTNLLFQECEKDCLAWKEEEMGQKIQLLLHKFYQRLQNKHFESFFTKRKKLLPMTPEELLTMQEAISRIKQKMLLYSVKALRKLKNTHLDMKKLQDFITLPDANLRRLLSSQSANVPRKRRISIQEMNVNLEGFRLKYLLEMFCTHYIYMSRSAISCDNVSQANMYAQAAENLCHIMKEENYLGTDESLHEEMQYLIQETESITGEKQSIHDVLRGYVRNEVGMIELSDTNTYESETMERIQSRTLPPSPARSPANSKSFIPHDTENDSIDHSDRRSIQNEKLPQENDTESRVLSRHYSENCSKSMAETFNPLYNPATEVAYRSSQSNNVPCRSTQNCKQLLRSDESTPVYQEGSQIFNNYLQSTRENGPCNEINSQLSNNNHLEQSSKQPPTVNREEVPSSTKQIQVNLESNDFYPLSTQNWEKDHYYNRGSTDTHITFQTSQSDSAYLQPTQNWEEEQPFNTDDSTAAHRNEESTKISSKDDNPPQIPQWDSAYLQPTQDLEEEPPFNAYDSRAAHQNEESTKTSSKDENTPQTSQSDSAHLQPTQNWEEEQPFNVYDSTAAGQNEASTKTSSKDDKTHQTSQSDSAHLQPTQNWEEEQPFNVHDSTAARQTEESTKTSSKDDKTQTSQSDSAQLQPTQN